MNKPLSIKEAADYLGVDTSQLIQDTASGKIKHVRGQRGTPYTYVKDNLDEYKASVVAIKEPAKKEVAPEAVDGYYMTAKQVAEYLGHKGVNGVYRAIERKRLKPVEGKRSKEGGNLFLKNDVINYKEQTEDYTAVLSFAQKAGRSWKTNNTDTAIRLMKYCRKKQLSNAWEGIKELLDKLDE